MKKMLLVMLLSIGCFADNSKINEYLNSNPNFSKIKYVNVWHRGSDNPGVFELNFEMYNKTQNLVNVEMYKELSIPVGFATFKITRNARNNGLLELVFDNEEKVNNILSEEGKYKMIVGLFSSLEKQITYIYNKGE